MVVRGVLSSWPTLARNARCSAWARSRPAAMSLKAVATSATSPSPSTWTLVDKSPSPTRRGAAPRRPGGGGGRGGGRPPGQGGGQVDVGDGGDGAAAVGRLAAGQASGDRVRRQQVHLGPAAPQDPGQD